MFGTSNDYKLRLESLRQKIKTNIEDEVFMDQIYIECNCCYSIKYIDEFVCCPQKHNICSNCLKTHATNIIFENGTYNIKCICMDTVCNTFYSDKVLEKILDKKVYSQMCKLRLNDETKYIYDISNLNLVKCQFCEVVWDIDLTDKLLYCMNCGGKTCLECGEKDHPDRPCDKIRKKIEEKLTQQNFLICTQCSRCILKESGCNAVRCPCGNNMCWGCKKSWGREDAHKCNCSSLGTNGLNEFTNDKKAREYINKLL